MSLPNYFKANVIETFGEDPQFITVYNDSTVVANGTIKALSPKWITGLGCVMAMTAAATNDADVNIIGIVNNKVSTGIAASTFGQVQVRGLYGSLADGFGVATSGTVAANDYLEVVNATPTVFIDQGTNGGTVAKTEASALAVENVTTNIWAVYLIGKPSSIKAT